MKEEGLLVFLTAEVPLLDAVLLFFDAVFFVAAFLGDAFMVLLETDFFDALVFMLLFLGALLGVDFTALFFDVVFEKPFDAAFFAPLFLADVFDVVWEADFFATFFEATFLPAPLAEDWELLFLVADFEVDLATLFFAPTFFAVFLELDFAVLFLVELLEEDRPPELLIAPFFDAAFFDAFAIVNNFFNGLIISVMKITTDENDLQKLCLGIFIERLRYAFSHQSGLTNIFIKPACDAL